MMGTARLLGVAAAYVLLAGLVLAALQMRNGVSYDTAQFSGQAILAAEQRSRIEDALALYPLLPVVLSMPFALLPISGLPPASWVALLTLGLLGAMLHRRLRRRDVAPLLAFSMAALVVLNPLALYALAEGPAAVLLMAGVLMLGRGLFGMARDGAVPDIMTAALALVLMASAHPLGQILALASLPGLALASPMRLFASAPGSMLLILLFPMLFGVFSLAYARWALGAEPFAFIDAAIGAAGPLQSGETARLSGFLPGFLVSLALTAPLPFAFALLRRRNSALFRPVTALIAMVALAGVLQVAFRGRADTPLLLTMGVVVAAVCAGEIARERRFAVLALLFAGWIWAFALSGSHLLFPKAARELASQHPELAPAAAISSAICGRDGVLVDTRAHPRLVQICGTAAGFITSGDPDFNIQLHSGRLTSAYVLVPEPHRATEFDVIAHSFPDLYRHGAPGYALIHDQAGWRLYARTEQKQPISEVRTSDADLLRR